MRLAVQESLRLKLIECFPLQVRLAFSSTGQTSTMSVRSVDGGGLNRMWIRLAATEDERVYGGEGVGVRLRRQMQFFRGIVWFLIVSDFSAVAYRSPKFFCGGNRLSLNEQLHFVWNTASQAQNDKIC